MFCCLFASTPAMALSVARACSPRLRASRSAAIFDVSGCSRTIGTPDVILREVSSLAGADARVAIAPTVTAAWLLASARPGTVVVQPGTEARALASMPMGWLGTLVDLDPSTPSMPAPAVRDRLAIFERWGLRTLGDLAGLPRADVQARLGPVGARLHQAATGEDAAPFVPMDDAPVFVDRQELEWPIDGLEPLAFVLARSCERLSMALVRADRGAVTIRTRLGLATRAVHERVLQVPSPMADARILRTLILLDLESHPPPAAIDNVTIDLDVTPGPIVQGSLIAPTLPAPDDLATLLARLTALMGASRVGTPAVLDTYDARAVGMGTFDGHKTAEEKDQRAPDEVAFALRRLRLPIAARVETDRQRPVRVSPSARGWTGGTVRTASGPWRSSGRWWTAARGAWDRDEWDVELATGVVYRLARDRVTGMWEIDGVLD
jgi:protein ImuB